MPADAVTERLLREITWEWTDVETLMDLLIPTVSPGRALRKYETVAKNNKGTSTKPPLTEDEQVASGARQILNDRLASQVQGGRIEIERDDDGKRRVKYRERREVADKRGCCPTCNRPFAQTSVESKPQPPTLPKPRPKVLYPQFPQWNKALRDGSSG